MNLIKKRRGFKPIVDLTLHKNMKKKRWGFMPIVDLKKREKKKRKRKPVPPLSESLMRFTITGLLSSLVRSRTHGCSLMAVHL